MKIATPKGRPMLYWVGKKPIERIKSYPTQLVEVHNPRKNSKIPEVPKYEDLKMKWTNLLFEGDNKDVLSTLLEMGFRRQVNLIYIDPPFASNKDYTRKVELKGFKNLGKVEDEEAPVLQQVMYEDMWKRDEYFQWIYERLLLMYELLSETGSMYIHLDWRVVHYVKLIMDEIFGQDNFIREIIWRLGWVSGYKTSANNWIRNHETILFYAKDKNEFVFNKQYIPYPPDYERWGGRPEGKGLVVEDVWGVFPREGVNSLQVVSYSNELEGFETQKPKGLLERIITSSSNPNDIVLDCFIGSGTTGVASQLLGRRWIGVDINKGAVQLTAKRIRDVIKQQNQNPKLGLSTTYDSFAIYKVNDYDLNILKTETKEIAIRHLGIESTKTDRYFDGKLGNNLVKIIDFNHPLTLLDLEAIKNELKQRPQEDRNITIVAYGKELSADRWIQEWNKRSPINKIQIIDLRMDSEKGGFIVYEPPKASIEVIRIKQNKAKVTIQEFVSPSIIKRFNLQNSLLKKVITDFKSMIDFVLIDPEYNGEVFTSHITDIPEKKKDLIVGEYEFNIPEYKTIVAVKIVDVLGGEFCVAEEI